MKVDFNQRTIEIRIKNGGHTMEHIFQLEELVQEILNYGAGKEAISIKRYKDWETGESVMKLIYPENKNVVDTFKDYAKFGLKYLGEQK